MYDLTTQVLVVDDMATMRKIILKACREIGFKDLVEASTGQRAWELLNSSDYMIGLIISDWSMPNYTGLDLLKRVRGDVRFKALPFVLITSETEENQISDAVKAGVDSCLVKPITTDVLKTKLDEAQLKTKKRTS